MLVEHTAWRPITAAAALAAAIAFPGGLNAQQLQPPARLSNSQNAQPISSQNAQQDWRDRAEPRVTQTVERIRWNPTRRVSTAKPTTERNFPARQVDWQDRSQPRPIRSVSESSPFNDPFGDRVAQTQDQPAIPDRGGNFQIPGTTPAAPGNNQLPPLPDTAPSDPIPNVPEIPSVNQGEDPPPPISPPMLSPMPMDTFPGDRAPAPCNEIFNGRNCCEDKEKCQEIYEYIRTHPISAVSLSITPRFRPDLEDPEREAEELARRLSSVKSRPWRNRDGEVIATGRMTNLSNGKVVVTQEDGELASVYYNELSDTDRCYAGAFWDLPTECVLSDDIYQGRDWQASTFAWKATAACHKPLYFDQMALERYGHTHGPILQPALSGVHFFGSALLFPYKVGIHPLNECQYPLGYYRAGNCAPRLIPPVPISLRGGLSAAAFYTGLGWAIP